MKDLLEEGAEYILTSKFQSDPIERRFSQYRFMSGGRFLVSLREVCTSEKILRCRTLLKLGDEYWLNGEEGGSDTVIGMTALEKILELEEAVIMEGRYSRAAKQ